MRPSPHRHSAALGIFVLLAPLAVAVHGQDATTQELRDLLAKAGTAADHGTADAVVVFDRREVLVEDSGLARTEHHTLTKVLTDSGARELSVTLLPYDPMSADVRVLRCRVLAADGAVRDVPANAVQDNPDPQSGIYWNSREKVVPVGRLAVGDGVELVTWRVGFTYALLVDEPDESRFMPPMRGHFYDIVPFWSDYPVLEQSYRVKIPADKQLQYTFFHGAAEVSDRIEAGMRVVTVKASNFEPAKPEKGMVAWSDVAPKLILTTSPDWQAKSVWFYSTQEKAASFAVTPEVKAMADRITAGLATDELKAAALTHWVAENIRYVGLHMGEGEGYTLHPASMTLRDRGGVCKDKAGMLTALLRAAGLEAYAGMTMAGERIEDIAADQFNHCITVWRRGGGTTTLLDPTWVPGVRELWSSREQQQEVLMGLPEGADLLTTPVSPPEKHPLDVTISSHLDSDGTLTGTISVHADGQSDATLRRLWRRVPRNEWQSLDETLLTGIDPRAEVVKALRGDIDDLTKPFRLEVSFRIPRYGRALADGSLLVVPLVARHPVGNLAHAEELFLDTSVKERHFPVKVGCSKLVRLRERMTLPKGSSLDGVPSKLETTGAGSLSASWRVEGDVLVVDETLALDRRVFEPTDWPALREAFDSLRRLAKHSVLVRPVRQAKGGA